MPNKLYEGKVWHRRARPAYGFQHSAFYLCLELDEIDLEARRRRLFAHNRWNLLSFYDSDYDALSEGRGRPGETAPRCSGTAGVSVLSMPRILGYVFNPVSFFLTRDSHGSLQHVVAEVHNTWGERHIYELPQSGSSNVYRSAAVKAFYVSPLLGQTADYELEIEEDADGNLRIVIEETDSERLIFAAGMELKPRDLTSYSLLLALVRYPFLNIKVIAAIHWHALRTWLRGAAFHPHPRHVEDHAEVIR
jgi:DUF1365 family protein